MNADLKPTINMSKEDSTWVEKARIEAEYQIVETKQTFEAIYMNAISSYKSSLIERLEEEVNSGEYNPESNSEANYALGLKKAIELIKQQ